MYQTVGHDAIHYYAECMDLPLYRREIQGTPIHQEYEYVATEKDETEDLYTLLQDILVSTLFLFYIYICIHDNRNRYRRY